MDIQKQINEIIKAADQESYLSLIQQAMQGEIEAIALGIKLAEIAPPEDYEKMLEITADENEHSGIYTAILSRYKKEV